MNPPPTTDLNLLLGILALQMDFIGRDALVQGMNAWVLNKSDPLGQILVDQGALSTDRRLLLDALVQEHLKQHHNNVEQSLASFSTIGSLRKDLQGIADPDVQASLVHLPAASASAPGDLATRASLGPSAASETRFRILRPHARGGLGAVFVAHDQEVHREVALKEIQDRFADHRESRNRFLAEAQITGALEHPSIVPVYGLGQYADGRPFYAMRFIRGDSLKDAIERYHRPESQNQSAGQRLLELRQLLGRFIDVCHAIAYAHSKGVLHRDLKPGNVMLGEYGETLVVDWGLARPMDLPEKDHPPGPPLLSRELRDSLEATQTGAAVGTPQYMSPEQAAGRLDQLGPASDVYSLGATLYALLTGKAPIEAKDVGTVLQKVQKADFRAPRVVKADVPRALEAICLKAMALDPKDRYPSPRDLAADIERWLGDEPVSVYREPLSTRALRWARRHQPLVTGLSALLITAVVTLSIATVLITREQARTQQQRQKAEANFQTALHAVNDMLTEVAQEQLAYEPLMEKKRQVLLSKARNYYQQFLDERGDDQHMQKETALAHKRLADISRLLGDYAPAKESYTEAIALLKPLAAEHPADLEYEQALADSQCYLGEVLRLTNHVADARAAYDHAEAIQQQLVAKAPERPEFGKDLARTYYNVGILAKDTQHPADAESAFHRSIDILDRLHQRYPDRPEFQQHLARAYLNLGPVLRATDRPQQAEDMYQTAIQLQENLVARYPRVPDYRYELGVTCNNLGFLEETLHHYDDAAKTHRRASDLFNQLAAQFPSIPVYQKELANNLNNLAIVLARQKQWPQAKLAWQQALNIDDKLVAEHPDVPDYQGLQGMLEGNLGWYSLQQKDWAAARNHLQQGIKDVSSALKTNPNHPLYRQALRDQYGYLAETLTALGDKAAAANAEKKRSEFATPSPGQPH